MELDVVYLARHGRTTANVDGRWQGRLDSPLTEGGRAHGAALASAASTWAVDAIFTSPLGRAWTTAQTVADGCDVGPVVLDDLSEMDHGDASGLTAAEAEQTFPGLSARRAHDKYRWRFPAGESYADVHRRAAAALETVSASGSRRPLIVSHEMIGRMLLHVLSRCDLDDALGSKQPHSVVYEITPGTGAVRRLSPSG